MLSNMYLGEKLQQQEQHKLDRITRTQWMNQLPNRHGAARLHKNGKAQRTFSTLFGRA